MSRRYSPAPRHRLMGGSWWTFCGISGADQRPIATTRDPLKVTCKNCRRYPAATDKVATGG